MALRGDLGVAGDPADPPTPGRVMAVRDRGDHGEVLWSVEARGEIWLGNPVIGADRTLYFADAVCIHDRVDRHGLRPGYPDSNPVRDAPGSPRWPGPLGLPARDLRAAAPAGAHVDPDLHPGCALLADPPTR